MKTPAAKARTPKLPVEPTSFVGRRHELHEVKRLLTTTRLLTLTGSGGVGKTRLAVSAAAEVARGFPDGVWFAPLAPVQDPLLVPQAIFVALGAQDRSSDWSLVTLTDFLAGKRLLLVIDNCEHLLDACAVLASTLLKACPDLHLLATSRQALGVVGEVRMPVPPMSLPVDGDEPSAESLANSEAVRLLSERAAAVVPGFAIDDENAEAGPPALSAPGRDPPGARVGRRPLGRVEPRPAQRGLGRFAVRPRERESRGRSSPADARGHHRMELRPARRGRAVALGSTVGVRRRVRCGGRRRGLRRRARAARADRRAARGIGREVDRSARAEERECASLLAAGDDPPVRPGAPA